VNQSSPSCKSDSRRYCSTRQSSGGSPAHVADSGRYRTAAGCLT